MAWFAAAGWIAASVMAWFYLDLNRRVRRHNERIKRINGW